MWIEKVALIALLNIVFYWKTLYYKYVSDDLAVHQSPPKHKNERHKRWLQFIGATKIWPHQDHAQTMFIHAFVCAMIYIAFGMNDVSFIAALLFSFNPAIVQGAVWTSGRGYTLPASCILIAMSLPWIAPVALFASCWFTAGFLAPLCLVGSTKAYLALWLPVVWLIHGRKFKTAVFNKSNEESFVEDRQIHPRKVILAIKTLGFYFALILIPFKITFYHSFLQSCAGNTLMKRRAYALDKFFWIGYGALALWLNYAVRHWDQTAWAGWWFIVTIAPFCNFRRTNQEISERYCYIPAIGLMYCLATTIYNNPVAVAVFLTMYAVRMYFAMGAFQDDYYIVEYAVMEDKKAWYAWHMRGLKRWGVSSFREALIMWVMAKMISPKEFKVIVNIASVLRMLKKNAESDEFLKLARENIVAGQEEEAEKIFTDIKQGRLPILT